MSAALNDPNVIPGTTEYQWQISTDNISWGDIAGATSSGYTINPVTATNVNQYYRVIVAATGNMASTSCRYTSVSFLLTAKNPSTAPTSIVKNKTVLCPGDQIILTASGATLGTNAFYRWYSGSCGGTFAGTGATITVSPSVATTYYVRIEGDCNTTACISTSIIFNCDIDADDDGIPDTVESGGIDPKMDNDLDGIPNWRDANYPGFVDTNSDGVNDNFDTDKDGVPDFLDRDSDNDGIPDVVESGGADANGDGIIDGYTDTDSDGFSDNVDANLTGYLSSGNGLGLLDTDGDGVPNCLDLDSDNDGIPDIVEVYGIDANNNGMIDGFADTDGDGLASSVDGDADGNGSIENTTGPLLKTGVVLANGRASSYPNKNMDADSKPNPYDLDSDGDGITDVLEAGFTDVNLNGIVDGAINAFGWNTLISSSASLTLPNRDGTGRANGYDIDSDDDGIPDNIEGLATANYLLPAYVDTDGDGIDNSYDDINGYGGKGINPVNTDGDAYPDYLDLDTDGDGAIDRIEGNDFNFNKLPDDNVTLTGIDTDGDGLDDRFDTDNLSAKVTSRYMGNLGTFTGPASPGSLTVVQKSKPLNTDRDWRAVEYILNCDFISFSASLTKELVILNWIAICKEQVDKYIVERSLDGVHFYSVQIITGKKLINENESYATKDDVSALTQPKIYYRVKAISANGKTKYTFTVFVLKGKGAKTLQILPNPIRRHLLVTINSNTTLQGQFTIFDGKGNAVFKFNELISKGYNVISYNNTSNLADGNYYLQLQMGGEYFVEKFVKKQ